MLQKQPGWGYEPSCIFQAGGGRPRAGRLGKQQCGTKTQRLRIARSHAAYKRRRVRLGGACVQEETAAYHKPSSSRERRWSSARPSLHVSSTYRTGEEGSGKEERREEGKRVVRGEETGVVMQVRRNLNKNGTDRLSLNISDSEVEQTTTFYSNHTWQELQGNLTVIHISWWVPNQIRYGTRR